MPWVSHLNLPYGTALISHTLRVPMDTPFLYQVTLTKRHRRATGMSYVGPSLASSILGYPFQTRPDKHQLTGGVPYTYIAAVGVDNKQ